MVRRISKVIADGWIIALIICTNREPWELCTKIMQYSSTFRNRNSQKFVFEMFKVQVIIAPEVMRDIFQTEVSLIVSDISTVWKVSKYGVFSDPYFPAFGLNTERYSVTLGIQSECGKIWTRNSVFRHFLRSEVYFKK